MPDLAAYERKCGSCDARIIWARTIAGRSMPVDAEPSGGGTVLLEIRQGFLLATVYNAAAVSVLLGPETRAQLRQSHFSTCPDADKWRKPRRA
jgi:hypothetical protein